VKRSKKKAKTRVQGSVPEPTSTLVKAVLAEDEAKRAFHAGFRSPQTQELYAAYRAAEQAREKALEEYRQHVA
jgi:uncharacterized protein YbjQ (UPF0145 family)